METVAQTRIQVKIHSILASKLDAKADCFKPVKFNISANLEELERGFNNLALGFTFVIITEPKVVKYHMQGRADMQGRAEQIKKAMTIHPSTKVPMVLYDIYQQVYAQIFVLSKMIDTPSPSPELLSMNQGHAEQEREPEMKESLSRTEEQLDEEQVVIADEEISLSKKSS